ncbi:hypothetical protein HUG17_2041 [Dermatophagoides farinae]|uniref:Uncharacterized protein n=1 Tax=Dermatophagoides farinae TaxID=6954 RepID=A0A9D4P9F0_DERFA|nr:uncharacterized protein LOC124496556 [Dermatophagoides farinae]KAH7646503.1 hypothetical protein HUG17_2041 [Dermatophagoides farinae]
MDAVDSIEAHLQRDKLRLEKISLKLDSNLYRCGKKNELQYGQQCALDNIDQIPRKLKEMYDRLESLKAKRDEFIQENHTKLEQLEKRSEKF